MVNLALAWAEHYQALHPEVRISVTGGGSGTGIAALINGTVDIANASRAIKEEERRRQTRPGSSRWSIVVARDAIAVIVNPDNPVDELTLEQISEIYSGEINNWTEVGGEDRPIVRLSRETNSGTHVYFLETVIRLGQQKINPSFPPIPCCCPLRKGSSPKCAITRTPSAMMAWGMSPRSEGDRRWRKQTGEAYVLPSVETVNDGTYPICARSVYVHRERASRGG